MSVFKRRWGKDGRRWKWAVSIETPAWEPRKRFFTLPEGSTRMQAAGIEAAFRACYASGVREYVDAVTEGQITVGDALDGFHKHQHAPAELRSWLDRQLGDRVRLDDEAMLAAWQRSIKRNTRASTKAKYRRHVEIFFAWVRQKTGRKETDPVFASDFTASALKDYQVHLLGAEALEDRERSPERRKRNATVNRNLASLSTYGTFLVAAGVVAKNVALPRNTPRLREQTNRDAAMSQEEWMAIRRAADRVDARNFLRHEGNPYPGSLLWDVLVSTGALVFEECINQLTPSQILFADTRGRNMVPLRIRGTKTENRDRTVYISPELADRLRSHCEQYDIGPDELIFACPEHGALRGERVPFRPHVVGRVWKDTLEEAAREQNSVVRYRPQHLRHTFGRFAIEGDPTRGVPGVDIRTLAELMGHGTNIQTTARYLQYASDSSEVRGGWAVSIAAGVGDLPPEESLEVRAAETIREAARREGVDPTDYLMRLLDGRP